MIASTDLWVSGCGPSDGGATEPTLSVAGRTNGEAYTVTAGARSISITAQAGATLSTTVEQASTGGTVAVTGNATTSPSWTAPAGTTVGEACQVTVTATLDGLTSQVSWTEYTAGSGGGGGGGGSGVAYTSVRQIDLDSAANDGPHTSGTHTATDGDGDSVSYKVLQRSGSQSGDVSVVNGTGVEVSGAGVSGVVLAAYDVGGVYDDEGVDRGGLLPRVIHLVVEGIDLDGDSLIIGMNTVNDTPGGAARMVRMEPNGAGYEVFTRVNTTNGAVFKTGPAIPASMVFTFILYDAHQVDAIVTEGSTPPTDLETDSVSIGAQSRGQQTDGTYEAGNMRLIAACVGTAQQTNVTLYVGRLA